MYDRITSRITVTKAYIFVSSIHYGKQNTNKAQFKKIIGIINSSLIMYKNDPHKREEKED